MLLKSQNLETKSKNVKQITDKNRNIVFFVFDDAKENYYIYYKKKLDESNYTVKSEFWIFIKVYILNKLKC